MRTARLFVGIDLIDVLAVTDLNNEDGKSLTVERVDNAIFTNSKSITVASFEFQGLGWEWILAK